MTDTDGGTPAVVILGAGNGLGEEIMKRFLYCESFSEMLVVSRSTGEIKKLVTEIYGSSNTELKMDGSLLIVVSSCGMKKISIWESSLSSYSGDELKECYREINMVSIGCFVCCLGGAFWKQGLKQEDYDERNFKTPKSLALCSSLHTKKFFFVGSEAQFYRLKGYEMYTHSKNKLLEFSESLNRKFGRDSSSKGNVSYFMYASSMRTKGYETESIHKPEGLAFIEDRFSTFISPGEYATLIVSILLSEKKEKNTFHAEMNRHESENTLIAVWENPIWVELLPVSLIINSVITFRDIYTTMYPW